MKPYFEDAQVTLYHGDCRDVLPRLAPGSADLIVTDPPYGVAYRSDFRDLFGAMAGDEDGAAAREGVAAALGVLREGRHVYVFGPVRLAGLPLAEPVQLIWDKGETGVLPRNHTEASLLWSPSWEPITFAVHVGSRANRERGNGRLAARLRRGAVLRVPKVNGSAVVRHPTEKPVDLLCQLIEASSCLGETVLDPFAGSGSTLVAAKLERRNAVGIEVEERYCEAAAVRLAQQVLPFAS